MPNYQNGKIYKIISPRNPGVLPYFGATTVALCRRMTGHRSIKTTKSVCKSKSLIECGDAIIVLVENYPCNNKEELDTKEAEYIINNDCCNRTVPLRTKKEYREDNKEKIKEYLKEYHKTYYEENKEKVNIKHKTYYEDNKERIAEHQKQYNQDNKERTKQYNQDNKERIAERKKQYYQDNNERHSCICGGLYTILHKKQHEKTNKHIEYVNNLL